MKYTIFFALLILAVSSCDTITTAATDAAKDVANTEFERHTGIDSVSTRVGSLDTLNVEGVIKREVGREVQKQVDNIFR
ncbi:hypothetical protein AAE02nite_25760 [Adhaeribacter aerolatus]|uniref:BON domain-containing protein n=1 Tax=Adhaeribacter aerolatus TaxID=670289 RepID=A0A512AYX0_9BACT|nr:hypothetical protein [Adhaeribacter aerolatus]GEO04912.1 hypothetical protein AAE02nite_25760 [Adhaeribacter aerolatus]